MENKVGVDIDTPMEMCMKGSGKMILRRVKGQCGTPTKISMKANG